MCPIVLLMMIYSESESDVVPASSDDVNSCLESDDEEDEVRKPNRPTRIVHKACHAFEPKFELGMIFNSKDDSRKAIASHGALTDM